MNPIVTIQNLSKTYKGGQQALRNVSLDIENGEILALLGPNGAGKTTLISAICGLIETNSGTITVAGFDVARDYRQTRTLIGLVPQEITLEPFETVFNTVRFSRGLFGKPKNPAFIEETLKRLSLWVKKDSPIKELSGGMKRRVLIAKALSHEPQILFLDEPTAGVDVELRRDMWQTVRQLQSDGVTIILTTHYIEEAEAIADRVGVISDGRLLLAEEKTTLMKRMGKKQLRIELQKKLKTIPKALDSYQLELAEDGLSLSYTYHTSQDRTGVTRLFGEIGELGIRIRDVHTSQSSLEEIFVDLVKESA